jgi:hypothetical protein
MAEQHYPCTSGVADAPCDPSTVCVPAGTARTSGGVEAQDLTGPTTRLTFQ